jgi:hypothetical protein
MESGDGSSTPRRGRRPGRADSRIASVTDRRHFEDGQRRAVEHPSHGRHPGKNRDARTKPCRRPPTPATRSVVRIVARFVTRTTPAPAARKSKRASTRPGL